MPTIARLGNTAPVRVTDDPAGTGAGERERVTIDNGFDHDNTVTKFTLPGDVGIAEALVTVTSVYGSHHSDDPPEWVESSNEFLAQLLADNYTNADHECAIGKPKGWEGLDPDAEVAPARRSEKGA